jgi:hypothetical protein
LVLGDYNGVSTRMRLLTSTNESKKLLDAAMHGLTKEEAKENWKEVIKDRLVMRWRKGASSSWESFFGNHKNTERMEEFLEEKSPRTIKEMVNKKELSVADMLIVWMDEDNFMLGREQRKIPWAGIEIDEISDAGMLFVAGLKSVMDYKDRKAFDCFKAAIDLGGGDLVQKAMGWAATHIKKDPVSFFYIKEFEKVQIEVERAILNSGALFHPL